MTIYERLKARWLELDIAINDGIGATEIQCYQTRRNITLPCAFKEYLLTVNGMSDGQTDENMVGFLSLNAIDRENFHGRASAMEVNVIFAEFSIYSHYYALRIQRSGEQLAVLAADGQYEKQIAGSFETFVGDYLANPSKVAYCWGG